ncbi:hypothetical protein STTU_4349 [Streptomyces sp. Tu6071]|uniref:hypothetical protein n=1 Tax=unclassified Streptomyces TaxID=2593676 RepID=UPI00020E63EA|nr:hypothetical protein CAC01_20480 [Streptomyces sp. CLI2509]EGJ77137.1 hypothetical protein STTU_4349 [Streptomyces sp. Tu6071]
MARSSRVSELPVSIRSQRVSFCSVGTRVAPARRAPRPDPVPHERPVMTSSAPQPLSSQEPTGQRGAASPPQHPDSPGQRVPRPNAAFRALRGRLSPGEFAARVRRAGREIGEAVSCDARYIGRVEAGEIRCPNYAYERVFLHLFPGHTLSDLGFAPRETVRGRGAARPAPPEQQPPYAPPRPGAPRPAGHRYAPDDGEPYRHDEESDVHRRAFIGSGAAAAGALATGFLGTGGTAAAAPRTPVIPGQRAGEREVAAVEDAVREIRRLDDRHGAGRIFEQAAGVLRSAHAFLDAGTARQSTSDRLHAAAGELSISVGWLAHDSGRHAEARSHYGEALAAARLADDAGLEAHAFCNSAFLARDAGHPREAVRAAQAGARAARRISAPRLLSLLALREASGRAGLADRAACEEALARAHRLYAKGPGPDDPEWLLCFYSEAELDWLEAQCWSTLGDWPRAVTHARRAASHAASRTPHLTRNQALYTAELAQNLSAADHPEEAATTGRAVLRLLHREVRSSRVDAMLRATRGRLARYGAKGEVASFLAAA